MALNCNIGGSQRVKYSCLVKAPCGGEASGKSPVDRGKQGTKRSLLVDGKGNPLGCVIAGANLHDSPLLRPTLEILRRIEHLLPEEITVHLDAGYDTSKKRELLLELGCEAVFSTKGEPLQTGARWIVERSNSWHNQGFKKFAICTERKTAVINAVINMANTVLVIRQLVREGWMEYRWEGRPKRKP